MSAKMDEFARQRELDTYRVVDTVPEQAYDDITRLASMICETPIALVSLIDRDRQWFKSSVGMPLLETSRDIAFCDHVIRQPDLLMEVQDANLDTRFASNPLVTGDDHIRFYAGMPLVTPGGAPIGTVCVLDQKPRELTTEQREALASLARLTMNLLEARHREMELKRAIYLDKQVPEAAPIPPPPVDLRGQNYTVVIFELQNLVGAVARLGDRGTMRALAQLNETLEARLRPGSGDSLDQTTGNPEMIVVLHGEDTDDALAALASAVTEFQRDTGLTVLLASAKSEAPTDNPNAVFLRADAQLSQAKGEFRAGVGGY